MTIKAWEIFRDSNPYEICHGKEFRAIKDPEYCMGQMIEDTIAILKEQDKTVNTWHHLWDAPDGSFKARCGNCGFVHFFVQGRCSQYRFCPQCGEQKVIKGNVNSQKERLTKNEDYNRSR